jgi:ABC-type nitrate/sulfonate/bicarbonate transport system substrate-binding protein
MRDHVCCIVVASTAFARSQGDVLRQYVRKLLSARDFVNREPKMCAKIQARCTGIDPGIAEQVIRSGFISYDDLIPDRQRTAQSMKMAVTYGILNRPCNLNEFISTAYA